MSKGKERTESNNRGLEEALRMWGGECEVREGDSVGVGRRNEQPGKNI